ncbi:hypothetical protein Pan189_30390 [Stratiformator vulcanicus]|uniref:Uncharacterized protein n=1 Tax=Stratiformator vulcanicus TaxID=2527980 RepID=A0A517R429_9PLAN|nr:hypothetical protein Pan189_30390 [Stratiformator vulcanicus]
MNSSAANPFQWGRRCRIKATNEFVISSVEEAYAVAGRLSSAPQPSVDPIFVSSAQRIAKTAEFARQRLEFLNEQFDSTIDLLNVSTQLIEVGVGIW